MKSIDAVKAARLQELREELAEAEKDGQKIAQITQARSDNIKDQIDRLDDTPQPAAPPFVQSGKAIDET